LFPTTRCRLTPHLLGICANEYTPHNHFIPPETVEYLDFIFAGNSVDLSSFKFANIAGSVTAVQGHPRSSISTAIESNFLLATSSNTDPILQRFRDTKLIG